MTDDSDFNFTPPPAAFNYNDILRKAFNTIAFGMYGIDPDPPPPTSPQDILQYLTQATADLKKRDPLGHIPKDWVAAVNPALIPTLYHMEDQINAERTTDLGFLPRRFDRLSSICGRTAYVVSDAPADHVEYSSYENLLKRYPEWAKRHLEALKEYHEGRINTESGDTSE